MGDDPIIPELMGAESRGHSSSATGGSNTTHNHNYGLGKGGQLFVVVSSCLALGLSVGAVVISSLNGRDSVRAERESRMAEYYIVRLDALLVEQGLKKAGDDFQKFKAEQTKE